MQDVRILANFIYKAPRGGPFTLQQRCLLALAQDIVSKMNDLMIQHAFSHTEKIADEIERWLKTRVCGLPHAIVFSLWQLVTTMSRGSAEEFLFTVSLLRSSIVSKSGLDILLTVSGDLPITVTRQWMPVSSHGLVRLVVKQDAIFDDNLLYLLSLSPAASSLLSIHAPRNALSDASAATWQRFVALEDIDITGSSNIGIDTLRSISSMSTIRSFRAQELKCKMTNEYLAELLAPNRMPLLECLYLDIGDAEDGSGVVELLKNRNGFLRILQSKGSSQQPAGEDQVGNQLTINMHLGPHTSDRNDTKKFDWFTEIHKALPRLETFVFDWSPDSDEKYFKSMLPFFSNVCDFPSSRGAVVVRSADDILLFAASMPRLRTLCLVSQNPAISNTDLSIFSSVENLTLTNFSLRNINSWPPRLVSLSIECSSPEELSEPQYWIEGLSKLSRLMYLNIPFLFEALDVAVAAAITSRLPMLRTAFLPECTPKPEAMKIQLSNLPHLERMIAPPPYPWSDPTDVYLPSFNEIDADTMAWSKCTLDQLPNVRTLVPRVRNPTVSQEDFLDVVKRFAPQLIAINDYAVIPTTVFSTMPRLKSIIFERAITETTAALLLRHLPLLREFTIVLNDRDRLPTFEWLKHKMLNLIRIGQARDVLPSDDTLPGIQITSESLPALRELSLVLSRPVEVISVSSANLRYLFLTAWPNTQSRPVQLKLSECHFLRNVILKVLNIKSLEITSTNNLERLFLGDCVIPPRDEDIHMHLAKPIGDVFVTDGKFRIIKSDKDRLTEIMARSLISTTHAASRT